MYDITQFGAVGDGSTFAGSAIHSAIDAAAGAGGGTVVVPAGRFLTGSITLKSNITLHLEPGAVLLGTGNPDHFPLWRSKWEGTAVDGQPGRAPMIGGEGLRNIAITGRGTIDGAGKWWWQNMKTMSPPNVRPTLIRFVDCYNVRIEGITVTNSPSWTITPLACDNVTITGITVINPPDSPNTDGINPDSCRNVRISDCHIDVGDDCITIKSGKETDNRQRYQACENITITNCTLLHGHGGVVIGSEITGSVRNVVISNCVFIGTDRGIRIKARRGRGGVVEDIRASNLIMDGVLCPIVVNLFYGCGAWGDKKVTETGPMPVNEGTPQFRRFRFSNITARRVKFAAAYILGLPEMFAQDMIISDCSLHLDPDNTESGTAAMASVAKVQCRGGFTAQNVDQLILRNVDVAHQVGPAFSIENGRSIELRGITARTPDESVEPVELRNIVDSSVINT